MFVFKVNYLPQAVYRLRPEGLFSFYRFWQVYG